MDLNPQRRVDDFLRVQPETKRRPIRAAAQAAYARLLAAQASWRAAQSVQRGESGEVKVMMRGGFDWQE